MSRAWNLAGLMALAALCLPPTTVRGSEPASKPPSELELIRQQLNAQFETVNRKLDSQANQMSSVQAAMAAVKRDLTSMERRLTELERTAVPASEVQVLRDQLDHLREELSAVRQSESRLRQALKPGSGVIPPTAVPQQVGPGVPGISRRADTSTLRVANDFPIDEDIVVNGTHYLVAPLSTLDIVVPAGNVSYFLPSNPVVHERALVSGHIHPIRIY
ncbi:MAG: hypothetical protein ACJ8F7_00640 [Gemmataceae bacterium]